LTRTLPLGSSVAVWPARPVVIEPVAIHVFGPPGVAVGVSGAEVLVGDGVVVSVAVGVVVAVSVPVTEGVGVVVGVAVEVLVGVSVTVLVGASDALRRDAAGAAWPTETAPTVFVDPATTLDPVGPSTPRTRTVTKTGSQPRPRPAARGCRAARRP
jgi:hypothetical protein